MHKLVVTLNHIYAYGRHNVLVPVMLNHNVFCFVYISLCVFNLILLFAFSNSLLSFSVFSVNRLFVC